MRNQMTGPMLGVFSWRGRAGTEATWSLENPFPRSYLTHCPSSSSNQEKWPSFSMKTSTFVLFTKPAPAEGPCPPLVTPPTTSSPSSCPLTSHSNTGLTAGWHASVNWMTKNWTQLIQYVSLSKLNTPKRVYLLLCQSNKDTCGHTFVPNHDHNKNFS